MGKFLDTIGLARVLENFKAAFAPKAQGVPFVVGTQTAATGTWTGVADTVAALYDGLTIRYWLPYAGSGSATLNLTLAGGDATGPVNCYYGGTTRLTTHYPAGSAILLTYRVNARINTNTTYTGWWADANYYADNDSRTIYVYYRPIAGETINAYKLCGFTADGKLHPVTQTAGTGTTKTVNTCAFDLSRGFVLYTTTSVYAAGSAVGNLYTHVHSAYFQYTFNETFTARRTIYLKGTIGADGLFTLDNSTYTSFAVLVPHDADFAPADYFVNDGSVYVMIGATYSSTNYYQVINPQPMYVFDGVKLVQIFNGRAASAVRDGAGQQIDATYLKGISANGTTLTVTKGDGTTETVSTQDTTYGPVSMAANGLMTPEQYEVLTTLEIAAARNFYALVEPINPSPDALNFALPRSMLPVTKRGDLVYGEFGGRSYVYVCTGTSDTEVSLQQLAAYPATTDMAGLMTPADKTKLDGLSAMSAPVGQTVTLTSAGWDALTQTVSVTGVTADDNQPVIATPAPASWAAYCGAGIHATVQGAGTLTFEAEAAPAEDLTVNVLIMG